MKQATLRNVLARFSINSDAAPHAVWQAIGVAALLGALYGAFVSPIWSEAVEFGQAWAGLVAYEHSSWGAVMLADPSLQITFPALLLLAGIKVWPLCMLCAAFFCAISFSAMAAAGFVFTRNVLLSVATPLLLLTFHFSNAHGYPVAYPFMWFQFGQTGMYVCVLALCLLACGYPLVAGFIGGLLAGVHMVWLPCFLMGAYPATFIMQRVTLPRLTIGLLLGIILSVGFLYTANHFILPPHAVYQAPYMPASLNDAASSRVVEAGGQKIRGTFNAHNQLFRDSVSPFKEAFQYFLPEMLFILLVISFYFTARDYKIPAAETLLTRRLLLQVAIPVAATFCFKIYEEADPYFALFELIDKRLPTLILRAIMNRWLNLTNVLIPVMTIALFVAQARVRQSWPATIALLLVALFLGFGRKPFWYIGGFLLVALIVYRFKGFKKYNALLLDETQLAFISALTLGFIVFKIVFLSFITLEHKPYSGTDAAESLVRVAKTDSGPVIVSSAVISINNFSPQLRTGRATIVPDKVGVYNKQTAQMIQVYCLNDASMPLGQFYANVKPCFENRSAQEWNVIAKETTATGLITPDSWKLQMIPLITAGGFSYYRFTN